MASCAAAHGLRPRFRKAGGPVRHRVAAPCACSPIGRGARSRAWRLRVRIPPSTPRPWVQRPGVPCKNGSRGWHSAGAPLGNGVTGSLLAFEATRCASESRFPSSCLFSANGQHAASVRRQSEFDSPDRLHAVVAQQVRAPARQVGGRRFEAGQPLAVLALLDQLAESPGPGPGGSRFESGVGHGR
jgi:hypothetical protein